MQEEPDASRWSLWTAKSNLDPPTFTDTSILIAVMGMTGAGKTTFINKITGLEMEIGHGLKSCTKDLQIASMPFGGLDVHLIDTPGFDDTDLTDADILVQIAKYLARDIRLSGILYLHPINARRVGGVAKRNLSMFRNLVGQDNMGNVKLVTTMWDCVTEEKGQAHLDELVRDFWNVMIAAGAQVDRCNDASRDGMRIVRSILKTSPVTLQLQREMEEGFRLQDTAAGKYVMDQLGEMQKKHDKEIQELRDELASQALDHEWKQKMQAEHDEKVRMQNAAADQLRKQNEAAERARKLLEADVRRLREQLEEFQMEYSRKRARCIIF